MEARQLLVDGQPSPWQPLNLAAVDADLQFTVPTGYYGILPVPDPERPSVSAGGLAGDVLVPRQNIRGPVLLRHQPIWHWGPL